MKKKKTSYELVPTHRNSDLDESEEEESIFEYNPSTNTSIRVPESNRNKISRARTTSKTPRWVTFSVIFAVLSLFLLISGFIVYSVVIKQSPPTGTAQLPPTANPALINNTSISGSPVVLAHSTSSLSVLSSVAASSPSSPNASPSPHVIINEGNPISHDNHQATYERPSTVPTDGILWQQELFPSITELSILVHDINHDGTPDLILDHVTERFRDKKYLVCPNTNNLCMDHYGHTPCRSSIIALDGINGSLVWELWVEFTPFASNCQHDLNSDGIPDCTFSGRLGSFVAVNIADGSILWYVDPAVTFPTYNYYYPLFIRDFDKDGVIDIITTHGGDTVYQDKFINRSPGFIFVISGKTGQQLSDRILVPDGHETYSSPVAYNITNAIEVVLFGTGGETIPGSLWAITVDSLQDNVDRWIHKNKPNDYEINESYFDPHCLTDEYIKHKRPVFDKKAFERVQGDSSTKPPWLTNCPVWKENMQPLWNKYQLCVYEVVPAGRSGTMIPPVIVDYNGDGVKDLLVSQFSDHVIMMDGATMSVVWDHYQQDSQSYSLPAPLYFNDDDSIDFAIQFNKGKWMNYEYSYVAVIDGTNGGVLWSLNCSMGSMSSPVTIRSSQKGQDGILFMANGCKEKKGDNERPKRKEDGLEMFDDNGVCGMAHIGVEKSVCLAETKAKRHGPENENDNQNHDIIITDENGNRIHAAAGGDQEPPPPNELHEQIMKPHIIDISEIKEHIPTNIWEENETDPFPDPVHNTKEFIQNYCGIPYDGFINKLYFITPSIVGNGDIKPLIVNAPYVYKPASYWKRHGDDHHDSQQEILQLQDIKAVRCSHIMLPLMVVTTPTIGDFNNDGQLDAAMSLGFNAFPRYLSDIQEFHLPKVSLTAFTIKNRVRHVYGAKIGDSITDFSYYSADKQPWTRYMGSRGNSIYEDLH